MTTRVLLAVALLSAVSVAAAQSPGAAAVDPVLVCFREFRAALERGDSAAAETTAERCLEASERVNGARTAVLALNLAEVRLDRGEPDAAYAPARRAYELATAGSSGVEPLVASLALGRAQLAVDRDNGVVRLREAIAEAERLGTAQSDAYIASVDLARATFTRGDYAVARQAWAAAARLAGASPDDPKIGRGVARTGEGAAIFMQATIDARRTGAALALGTAIEVPAAREASAAFAEALDLLEPSAESTDQHALTLGQRAYAEALAWDGAVRAKMQGQGEDLPRSDRRPPAGGRCSFRLVPEPAPDYPHDALLGSGFGAVVMRVQTDARGAIVNRQVAAAIPTGSFSDAVEAVSGKWRVEVEPDAAPGCRRDGTQYAPILFVADAAQEAAAGKLIDEIIVNGRTPPALRAEIERAEDAVFERFNAITSNHEFEIHCHPEKPTGTRIPQRVCAPSFVNQAGRNVVLAVQGNSGAQTEQVYAAEASNDYRQLEAEMRKLASEDPEFFAALQHLIELREAANEAAKRSR